MNILLSGAGGFIGKNIFESINKDFNVITISHKTTNLNDYQEVEKIVKKEKIDSIIHCATKPGHRKAADRTNLTFVNLQMAEVMLKLSYEHNIKLINIGSGCEYDMQRELNYIKEEDFGKILPSDEVGFHKYMIGKQIEQQKNAYNLRCFGVFGKYEDYAMRFISNTIVRALFNKEIIINEQKKFSFLYIDDLVNVIRIFLERQFKYNSYNIVPDYVTDMLSIAEKIKIKTDSKSAISVKGLGFNYTGSNKRLKAETDYAFTDFDIALDRLIEFYKTIICSINANEI